MSIHLTKIYTRTGDDGTTGLSDFSRVPKDDSRLVAYADCEEANAAIGQVLAHHAHAAHHAQATEQAHATEQGASLNSDIVAVLAEIQNDLFDAGADLATPISDAPAHPPLRIEAEYIDKLERWCDHYNAALPALDSFILPGGTVAAAGLHTARVVTRRAERAAWQAVRDHPDTVSVLPARYLNRLSDLLFILARVANQGKDVKWVPGGERKSPLR